MSSSDSVERGGPDRRERLLGFGRALTSELDLPALLDLVLEAARELTGARYAAVGVLTEDRNGLAQFLSVGFDETTIETIGKAPEGRGLLGLLISEPTPIRLRDLLQHPRSYGFPAAHPPMRGFLGAPITIRGEAWGNLYLTERRDGEDFDEEDLETIVVLTEWAAVAIDNARLFDGLQRALKARRVAMEIATAVGSDTDLPSVLELIVERGRALVGADALLIWLREGDELRIAAVSGDAEVPEGATVPLATSTAGRALGGERSVRSGDARLVEVDSARYGVPEGSSALIVPLVHRGEGHGVLMAFDRAGSAGFDDDDQRALEAFAASAATAVATARSVEAHRLRDTMAAAEYERRRWARELHDETLQRLASLKLSIAGAAGAEPDRARSMLAAAAEQLDDDIAGLRAIIADLRPAALDELGLEPALRTLVMRVARNAGLEPRLAIELGDVRLEPDLETIAYRVAQEALTNVAKHAKARSVTVVVRLNGGGLRLTVTDDGLGLGDDPGEGYGIAGMRERAALASGRLEITAGSEGGTRVTLDLPPGGEGARRRAGAP